MRQIPLTQGYVAVIDDVDYECTIRYKWWANETARGWYAEGWVDGQEVKLHHFILGTIGSGVEIDHVDGDGLNNRRLNLRVCTRTQNRANATKTALPCSSTYKGVAWNKANQRWVAYIKKDYIRTYLGSFNSELMAATAYNEAATRLFGEFARLNDV